MVHLYAFVYVFVQEDGELTKKIPKKKPPRVEDTRSKKEHVNVVFIGHVGKFYFFSIAIRQLLLN